MYITSFTSRKNKIKNINIKLRSLPFENFTESRYKKLKMKFTTVVSDYACACSLNND